MAHMFNSKNTSNKSGNPSKIVVFGGSGIIGQAIAKKFGQQGWAVGVHYHRNRSSAEETVAAIKTSDGNARLYQADVSDLLQIEKLFQSFVQDYGSLNLLVWTVGVARAPWDTQ